MTATVQAPQDTGAPRVPTGPLTVPIQIIRAAGARHRDARNEGAFTMPAWALLASTGIFAAAIVIALLAAKPISLLLITVAVVGLVCAYTPDVLAALPQRLEQD